MRYLKRFNESVDASQTLLEFCNDSLSILLDDGFYIEVGSRGKLSTGSKMCTISIRKRNNGSSNSQFEFDEIKDEFVPFYEMLKSKYEIVDIYRGRANYPCFVELMTSNDEHILSDEQILFGEYNYKEIICIFIQVMVD